MNQSDGTPEDEALREVQGAYRGLPGVEPDAALDARVRAAIAAEIAQGPADTTVRHAKVIPLARWRRVALPFAAAAAVLVAVGVNQLQRPSGSHLHASAETLAPAASPGPDRDVAPASAPPQPVAIPASPPPPPPPPEYRPPRVNPPLVDLPMVAGPPPPAAIVLPAVEPAALEAQRQRARESSNALAAGAASDSPLAMAKAAAPAASPPAEAVDAAAPTADDAAAFADLRRLLAQHRRDAAIVRLKRWRETSPDTPLPADLKALETDVRH